MLLHPLLPVWRPSERWPATRYGGEAGADCCGREEGGTVPGLPAADYGIREAARPSGEVGVDCWK